MLTSLLVDEILLLRYMNWSTHFRGLSWNEEMIPPWLKHMNSVFSEFKLRPMFSVACSRLCSRDSASAVDDLELFTKKKYWNSKLTQIYCSVQIFFPSPDWENKTFNVTLLHCSSLIENSFGRTIRLLTEICDYFACCDSLCFIIWYLFKVNWPKNTGSSSVKKGIPKAKPVRKYLKNLVNYASFYSVLSNEITNLICVENNVLYHGKE